MTGKLLKRKSTNMKIKTLAVLFIALVLVSGMVLIARAFSGPTIDISPANGATVSQVRPVVRAILSSEIDDTKTLFNFNGSSVKYTYDRTTNSITYTPDYDLPDGNYNVDLTVYDLSGNSSSLSSIFTIKTSRPKLDSLSPAVATSNRSPVISLNVNDPDQINNTTLKMTIDDVSVPATFAYKELGYWDSYDSFYWVKTGDDYTNGTIIYQTNNLSLGNHKVEVSISDKLGNVINYRWSFAIATPPAFTDLNPADGTSIGSNQPNLSAKINISPDSGNLDLNSTKIVLDSVPVNYTYSDVTGVIKAQAPAILAEGKHTWQITASTSKGISTTSKYSFSVDTKAPAITIYPPTGTIVKTNTATKIGFDFSDVGGIDEKSVAISIDGNVVTPTIKYNEVWVYPPYQDPYMNGYDYTKGSIYYYSPTLANGVHNVTFNIKDKAGNLTTQNTNITYSIPFGIGNYQPADKSNVSDPNSVISFTVSNSGQADWNSLAMTVDGNNVTPQIDTVKGLVSYNPVNPFGEGSHSVAVSLADTSGKAITANWSFGYYAPGPRLNITPADGAVVQKTDSSQENDKIKIAFTDVNSPIDESSIALKVNGQNVPTIVTYNKLWDIDPYSGDPIFKGYDYKNGQISSQYSFGDGTYTASLTVKDQAGYVKSKVWNFNIAIPPQPAKLTPGDNETIKTKKPHFNILVSDANGPAIDSSSIKLFIDDSQVSPIYTPVNQNSGNIEYDANFSSEGTHTAKLVVADNLGNSSTTSWSYFINTYGDMAISPDSCKACHSIDQYGKHVHTKGPDFELTGGNAQHGQKGTCGHCHVTPGSAPITSPDFCAYCHGDNNPMSAGPVPSGSYPVQAQKSCFDCHSKKSTWTGAYTLPVVTGYPNEPQPTVPVVHNVFDIHKVNNASCTACHADNLTREHNIRKDSSGQAFTCNTCHSSTRPEVINAIQNKTTDCMACHGQTNGHETVHTDSLDDKCQTCHKGTISSEHLSNTQTQTKQLDCKTCHQSTRQDVKAAIASENLNCSSCHDNAHGLPLQKVTPSDIPLYPQLTWNGPVQAMIWAGEAWLPDEYIANGQVMISNRSNAVSGDAVWSYYSQQLTAQGWTLADQAPSPGTNYFRVTFTKSNSFTATERKVLLIFYGGEDHSSGPIVSSGYRLEILYK